MTVRNNYTHTLYASYLGYVTQAIVNNFAPLLFLTFQRQMGVPLEQITLLVSLNFAVQLVVDALSAHFVDKLGYRFWIVAAHVLAALGLAGLAILPQLMPVPFTGLLIAIVLYAIGGGLIEVLVSPIVEACPTEKKEAAMSLLHSFYCWGHVFVVLSTTAFFAIFGVERWPVMALIWAALPLGNAFYFARVPINRLTETGSGMSIGSLFKSKLFWIFALLMVCAGASEQGMSQWASTFAESGLKVSKAVGDLTGPCLFAAMMGLSRVLHAKFSDRLSLPKVMAVCAGLCVIGYLLASLVSQPAISLIGCAMVGFSVGVFWPGTFSLSAAGCPSGGTAMFALLALAGDLGCSSGPAVVGLVASVSGGRLQTGLLAAIVFPVLLLAGLWLRERARAPKRAAVTVGVMDKETV
ncbi:MAG: MFS transporter [Eubacteriales bacterium]|nr:MFS transporter [Eubacteriales bacterium]